MISAMRSRELLMHLIVVVVIFLAGCKDAVTLVGRGGLGLGDKVDCQGFPDGLYLSSHLNARRYVRVEAIK